MGIFGTTASQTRKYAGYMPSGYVAAPSWLDVGDSNTKKTTTPYIGTSTIHKILFVSDTCSTISTTTANQRRATAGYANKSTAGYMLGGESADGSVVSNQIERLLFSGEINSVLGTTLSVQSFAFSGAANETTSGYTFGGYGTSSPLNAINRMTFSTETNTAISATMSTARHNSVTFSNGPTAIYNGSGYSAAGSSTSEIRKLTLSNETMSVLSATLSQTTSNGRTGVSNVGTAGYIYGYGWGDSTLFFNASDKITYSNETRSVVSATSQALAIAWYSGFANANISAYFMGGATYFSPNTDTVTLKNQKMPFSTETPALLGSNMDLWKRQSQGYSHSQ